MEGAHDFGSLVEVDEDKKREREEDVRSQQGEPEGKRSSSESAPPPPPPPSQQAPTQYSFLPQQPQPPQQRVAEMRFGGDAEARSRAAGTGTTGASGSRSGIDDAGALD